MLIPSLPVAVAVPWSFQRLPLARAEDLCECISWLPSLSQAGGRDRVETQASEQLPNSLAGQNGQGSKGGK